MASRKEQKEQARAARLAKEQAVAAKRQRTRRLQIFGGAITAAVIVVVVAIVVSTSNGGSGAGGLRHGPAATSLYDTVKADLAGIPQHGTTLGYPSAKVTLTYFGDLECPICMDFTVGLNGGGLPEFIQKDVRTRIAKIVYRSVCSATCNAEGEGKEPKNTFQTQQIAAYAAGMQNLFWDFAELFYREQGAEDSGYVTPSFISGIAAQIPDLNLSKWQLDRKDPALVDQFDADQSLARTYKFDATPSFLISGPKESGSLGSGLYPYSDLAQAVKAVT